MSSQNINDQVATIAQVIDEIVADPSIWKLNRFETECRFHGLLGSAKEPEKPMSSGIKRKDKPVLVLKCQHGKVYRLTGLTSNLTILSEIFAEMRDNDTIEIISLAESPNFEVCGQCDFD